MFKIRSFMSDARGNTAIMTALALVPILLAAGAGIDMVRANYVQSVLQGAADAAAIAGGASGKTDKTDLDQIVSDYLHSNGAMDVMTSVEAVEGELDKGKRTFEVKIRGKLNTSLMRIAGISDMDVGAFSQVVLGGAALEVALVLDNTASMNSDGRLTALKSASTDMIDKLMDMKSKGADVKVGIVPFADYVNVGIENRNEPWLSVPADSTTTSNVCNTSYPDASKSNCRTETGMYNNDGVATPYTYEVCDWVYGTPVTTCADQTYNNTWNGCVGSRSNPLDEHIGTLSTPYPGLQNTTCPAPLTKLTDKGSDLKSKLDAMNAVGNTYIPAGLLWGWNLLDSQVPIQGGKTKAAMSAAGGTKVLVLMTDGANTLSADYPWHWGSNAAAANTKTAALCDNIRTDGIVVYTIAFMVTDSTSKDLLTSCAGDATRAYSADNAVELAKAFEDIGSSLVALRLAK